MCLNPPVPATNPQHPLHAPDAPPALLLNSRYDPSTPYQGARRVADQLPEAVLVVHDGFGHGVANRVDCTRRAFTRYLLERALPPHDLRCP
ncbi:alpha/beta hydrolase [Actinophytocola xanthii]|uniref:alpha/beta hydrolase n=1 Tax=Actinophytocola xanthii TaxID=1912961 RepID=UPI0009F8536C